MFYLINSYLYVFYAIHYSIVILLLLPVLCFLELLQCAAFSSAGCLIINREQRRVKDSVVSYVPGTLLLHNTFHFILQSVYHVSPWAKKGKVCSWGCFCVLEVNIFLSVCQVCRVESKHEAQWQVCRHTDSSFTLHRLFEIRPCCF